MPSAKRVSTQVPTFEAVFVWGTDDDPDEITMRLRSNMATLDEIEAEAAAHTDLGALSAAEQVAAARQIARDMSERLVEWNMFLDDDETEMIRRAEDLESLPFAFLVAAKLAADKAEAESLGKRSRPSAAG